MKIKKILLLSLIIIISLIILLYVLSKEKRTVIEYLETKPAVTELGWKITKVKDFKNYIYVELTTGKQEATFELFYAIASTASNAAEERNEIELKYAGFVQELCPNVNTEEGKKFWDSIKKDFLVLNPVLKYAASDFGLVRCTRTESYPDSLSLGW